MKLFFSFLLLIHTSLFAMEVATSKQELCDSLKDPHYLKSLAESSDNLLTFSNPKGFFYLGLCWWHTRFQRNALFLTYFDITKPIAPRKKRMKAVYDIIQGRKFVEISGYRNLQEFSKANRNLIVHALSFWQLAESQSLKTYMKYTFSGKNSDTPQKVETQLEKIYQEVEIKNRLAFVKLALPGLPSHGLLVISAKKESHRYILSVINSNKPSELLSYEYVIGKRAISYGDTQTIPYLERTNEMDNLEKVVSRECR